MNIFLMFLMSVILTVFLAVFFRKKRYVLLLFPSMAVFPGVPFLLRVWLFMFEQSRYSLANRLVQLNDFHFSHELFSRSFVLGSFYIWFTAPVNACFLLYALNKPESADMEYFFDECRVGPVRKFFFSNRRAAVFKVLLIMAADIIFCALIFSSGVYRA